MPVVGPRARSIRMATTILLYDPTDKQRCLHRCDSVCRVRQPVNALHKRLSIGVLGSESSCFHSPALGRARGDGNIAATTYGYLCNLGFLFFLFLST